VQLEAPVDE
jgi:hypothetical protein